MNQLLPVDTLYHRAKLTADDFDLLDRSGAFAAYQKTELIDGDIYFVNAQHRPHGMVKMRLYDALRDTLLRIESPYRPVSEFTLGLSPLDRPDPDLMLTREADGPGFVPLPSVALIVEVSDTTLDIDMGRKMHRYAAAGVPEYWVANVGDRIVHQMWSPNGDLYAEQRDIAFGEAISAATFPNLTISTTDL